jgi:hypothetical protein
MIRGLEGFSSLSMFVLNGTSVLGDLELFAQTPRGFLEVYLLTSAIAFILAKFRRCPLMLHLPYKRRDE